MSLRSGIEEWLKWWGIFAGITELALAGGVLTSRLFGFHLRVPFMVLAGILFAVASLVGAAIAIMSRPQGRIG